MSGKGLKSALRILSGVVGGVMLLAIGLLLTVRVVPIPLTPLSLLGEATLSGLLGGDVDMDDAKLVWSESERRFIIRVDFIKITDRDGAMLQANNVSIGFSATALWQEQTLAVAYIDVHELRLTASQYASLPFTYGPLSSDNEGVSLEQLTYFELLAVRNIVFEGNELPENADNISRILLIRDGNVLQGTADIAYRRDGKDTKLEAKASLLPGNAGTLDVTFERINPRDIGLFSRFLAPLQALQLPISGDFHVDFDGSAKPQRGGFNLFVEPGALLLSQAVVPIEELTFGLDVDFLSQRVTLADGRFNVAGVGGALVGDMDFETRGAFLSRLNLELEGRGIRLDRPTLFQNKLDISEARATLNYDFAEALLSIDRLTLEHNYGRAETTGQIFLANNRPIFDIVTNFGAMSRDAVSELWPTPVAKRTRDWVDANIVGGQLEAGSLVLRATLDELVTRERGAPMREEALRLDLEFDEVDVRYIKDMPPVRRTRAGMSLRGTSFTVEARGGTIDLPVAEREKTEELASRPLTISEARIRLDDFRAPGAPAEITLTAEAGVADVVRVLQDEPLKIARNVDFDFDRIGGRATSTVKLRLPLIVPKGEKRTVLFDVTAQAPDFQIADPLGPFTIESGGAHIHIDNDGLDIQGRGVVNGAPIGFAWQQPFDPAKANAARMAVNGKLTPQHIADLGQAWAGLRLMGDTHANVLITGPITKPNGYRVYADLTEAAFMPRPLAYTKPAETPAHIEAAIRNDDDKVEQIRARLHVDGDEVLATQMNFEAGVLRKMTLTPVELGRNENLKLSIEPQEKGSFISLTADVFDAATLFETANREVKTAKEPFAFLPFLGPDFVVEGRFGKILGANEVELDGGRLRLFRQNGLHEEAWLEGVFKDGYDLLARIERADSEKRNFSLQTENAGNVFRMFNWVEGFYGGALSLQGSFYDDGMNAKGERRDLDGRLTLVSFRARNVGVLAQILTLASLTGIADTLGGDGIKFDKAKSNFAITDGRVNISGGQVNGPAVGLTAQGDFDMVTGDVDIGGTLIPAYSLNSFLGKIPLVGGILSSREGEGLIGIGYRIAGENGDVGVLVNPLSVLTPGVFRRIFEIGIGLPSRDPDPAPDVSAEPEAGTDSVIE